MDWVLLVFGGMLGGNLAGVIFRTLNQGLRMNALVGLAGSVWGFVALAGLGLPIFPSNEGTGTRLHPLVVGGLSGVVTLIVFALLRKAMIR